MSKKALHIFLILSLLIAFPPYISKAYDGAFIVSDVTGNVGDEVSVNISLDSNPGIATFTLKLDFDKNKLEPVDIIDGAALSVGDITSNLQIPSIDLTSLDFVTAVWYSAFNISGDGVLYTVKFRIKESGSIPLTLSYELGNVSDGDGVDVCPAITNGVITAHDTPSPTSFIRINATTPNASNEFDAVVTIENNPGIATFTLKLDFDKENLEPISIVEGAMLGGNEITSNMQIPDIDLASLDFVTAVWYNASDILGDGELFVVKFKIKQSGIIPLTLSYVEGDISNQSSQDVNPIIENSAVEAISEDAPRVTVIATKPNQDGEFEANVALQNNPGIATFTFKLNFDKAKIEPISITKGTGLTVGDITSNFQIPSVDLTSLDFATAVWYNASEVVMNGVMFTVKFKVKPEAKGFTELSVSYVEDDISNEAGQNVIFYAENTSVRLTDSDDYVITVIENNLGQENSVISGEVELNIANNTLNEQSAAVVVAVYAKNGRLMGLKFIKSTPLAVGDNPITLPYIEIPNASESEYYAKIMCWNGLNWMGALSKPEGLAIVEVNSFG